MGTQDAPRVLVCDDHEAIVIMLCDALQETCSVRGTTVPGEALDILAEAPYDILLTDLRMPDMAGTELIRRARDIHPGLVGIVLTSHATKESAIAALRQGVYDYLDKPIGARDVEHAVARAWRMRCAERANLNLLRRLSRVERRAEHQRGDQLEKIAGFEATSPVMREVLSSADLVASNPSATVLLGGETGVGKGWLARRIHGKSPLNGRPFLEINCAGLGSQLVESELFGYQKGAFTGAEQEKRGLVEAAEGGTLFLDEVGDLPLQVQAQLLTFLDTKTFRPVGGTQSRTADLRIIAATNCDLKEAVHAGRFREDLYYRLSVFPIVVPPLRERRGDIPDLAARLLQTLCPGGARPSVDARLTQCLCRHHWPGNVRELRNVLERALILSRGELIEVAHLPIELREGDEIRAAAGTRLADVEQAHILAVLRQAEGNRTSAAKLLGISRSTLNRKLARYQQASPQADSNGAV